MVIKATHNIGHHEWSTKIRRRESPQSSDVIPGDIVLGLTATGGRGTRLASFVVFPRTLFKTTTNNATTDQLDLIQFDSLQRHHLQAKQIYIYRSMCWSFRVSVATAIIEAFLLGCVIYRSSHADNPTLQQHLIYLPGMLTILIMEIIEAMLWALPPDELQPVELADATTCSPRNRNLTLFTWLVLLPWQPYFILMQDRRAADSQRIKDALKAPENLALIMAAVFDASVIYSMVAEDPVLRTMEDSRYFSYYNTQTCTYIGATGRHGFSHLHWTVRLVDSYLTPNIFTYVLLWSAAIYARPLRQNGAIWTILVFLGQIYYYGGSFEAGSVWCWLAVLMFVILAIESFMTPMKEKPEAMNAVSVALNTKDRLTDENMLLRQRLDGNSLHSRHHPFGTVSRRCAMKKRL